MASFSLSGLPPMLLEKIVTKVELFSYVRLQKTCRGMERLVRMSRNITICTDPSRRVHWKLKKKEGDPTGSMARIIPYTDRYNSIDLRSLHGLRLNVIIPPLGCNISFREVFEEFRDNLIRHRITCSWWEIPCDLYWTKSQLTTLLAILKPRKVIITSMGKNSFEAVFDRKEIKIAHLILNYHVALQWMKEFLTSFEEITLTMGEIFQSSRSTEQILDYMMSIIQILASETLPHLNFFRFQTKWCKLPSVTDVEEKFRDFQPAIKETESYKNEYTLGFPFNAVGSACELQFSEKSIGAQICFYGPNNRCNPLKVDGC